MKLLRKLLFPFAAVYYVITLSRNFLFNRGWLSSKTYGFPVICIGNLSTGGTGKTPMTEYVLRLFQHSYKVATLSRGYGRQTSGYLKVSPQHAAADVGDEPLQFARKFPQISVSVCEDRQAGIQQIVDREGQPEVLVLDDAFQHRKVKAGYQILLTSYGDIYAEDYLLPAGNLREPRKGAMRADLIVVTKCPNRLSIEDQAGIIKKLTPASHQKVYFSAIQYSTTIKAKDSEFDLSQLPWDRFVLVTGIANPKPLIDHLKGLELDFEHQEYADHHNFALNEIEQLDTFPVIITTEKDYMRLDGMLKKAQLFYLPIEFVFLKDQDDFDNRLRSFAG